MKNQPPRLQINLFYCAVITTKMESDSAPKGAHYMNKCSLGL